MCRGKEKYWKVYSICMGKFLPLFFKKEIFEVVRVVGILRFSKLMNHNIIKASVVARCGFEI